MIIKEADIESQEYSDFIDLHGYVFNTTDWLRSFGDLIITYGIYDKSGKLIGAFNIHQTKLLKLNFYRDPLYAPDISLCYDIKAKNISKRNSNEKKIINLVAKFFNNYPYSTRVLTLPHKVKDILPFLWNDYKASSVYTYIVDLKETKECLFTNFSTERRNDIKRAEKKGITIKKEEDYSVVKSLVQKTFERQDMSLPLSILDILLFKYSNKDNSFAFIAFDNDVPIAATFCIYYKSTVYYILGGYDSENGHSGAGACAIWSAMQYSRDIGLCNFDFEGSMQPDIEKFFRGFGGTLQSSFKVSKAWMPLEILYKFKRRNLF